MLFRKRRCPRRRRNQCPMRTPGWRRRWEMQRLERLPAMRLPAALPAANGTKRSARVHASEVMSSGGVTMGWRILNLLLCLACVGHAAAQTPHSKDSCNAFCTRINGCPKLDCCPDDYCHKSCPTIIPVPRCGGPDDYCRKAAPCIPDLTRCCGPDDYCRKSLPCLLCPPLSPYLQCGPPRADCLPPNQP